MFHDGTKCGPASLVSLFIFHPHVVNQLDGRFNHWHLFSYQKTGELVASDDTITDV
jgi:hypothetical protein